MSKSVSMASLPEPRNLKGMMRHSSAQYFDPTVDKALERDLQAFRRQQEVVEKTREKEKLMFEKTIQQ